MERRSCYLALLPALVTATVALEFLQRGRHCEGANQVCTSIFSCAAYQTKEDILRHRPTPCGFSGETPLICCDAAETVTSGPLTVTRSPLPEQCGQPRSNETYIRFSRDVSRQLNTENRDELVRSPEPSRPVRSLGFDEPFDVSQEAAGIGGVEAELGKWPWMVLFGQWTDAGLGDWFCGGTLITDRLVLTAAHCLRPEQAGTVGARIGDHDLIIPYEVSHQERNVSSIVRHPHYVGQQNDLAVVRLEAPVELTEAVRPICLPPAGAEHDSLDVEMAGWGRLEFAGEPADVLQEVLLRVTDPAACERAYRRVPSFDTSFPGGFQDTKICAGSRDDQPRDACPGDSGGPLMVQLTDGTYQLIGVVSTGVGCGNPKFPGIYTKVSAYIDWIGSNLT